ncbi:MAG: response regulator [Desulfobacterales bacterium]|nr:response regulator [Desulfobacterales bacterium]
MVVCTFYLVLIHRIEADHLNRFQAAAAECSHQLDRRVNQLQTNLRRLSENNAVTINLMLGMTRKVEDVLTQEFPPFNGAVYFVLTGDEGQGDGELIFPPGMEEPGKRALAEAALGRTPQVFQPMQEAPRGPLTVFSLPVTRKDGTIVGTAVVVYDLAADESLWKLLVPNPGERLLAITGKRMINLKDNRVVPLPGGAAPERLDHSDEGLQLADIWLVRLRDFDHLYFAASPQPLYDEKSFWFLVLSGIGLMIFTLLCGVAVYVARSVGRPVADIAAQADLIAGNPANRELSESNIPYVELKQLVAAFNRLLTTLAESEQKLARAKKMEAVGLLAGGVAHDLNNILSGLVGYPEILMMNDDLPPDVLEIVELIQSSGNRAAFIVNDLLTIARGVASHHEILNLNWVVESYFVSPEADLLRQSHGSVTLDTELDPELLNIKASMVHLGKVVANLILNAAEAMGAHGDRVVIKTENRYIGEPFEGYETIAPGEYVVLTITDNGPGIPPEHRDQIFEPFYTKKKMGKSGTGLGLTIVWNTVHDTGGFVDMDTGDWGCRFDLYFPATREDLVEQSEKPEMEAYKGQGETVLIVDDEPDQQRVAAAMLDVLGYKSASVSNGEEAVAFLRKYSADLVLIDMIMGGGMNGRETYEALIRLRPGQKAVIASGFAETVDVQAAQALGAGQYVKKPYTIEKIGTAIRAELDR